MVNEDVVERLASNLYGAATTGEPINPLTKEHDMSVEDAYSIQSQVVTQHITDGARPVGHKIGLTSEGIQNQLGVSEPDFGQLLDTMLVEEGVISVDTLIAPRIEPEIGFILGEDLTTPVTYTDVLQATDAVLPVFEVIDSRVKEWDIRIQDTIADNASSALFILGDTLTEVNGLDLSLVGVKLYRNGKLVDSGLGANVMGNPANAVAWLANTIGKYDQHLEKGDVILSGSFTPAIDLKADDIFTAEFSSIGSVTVCTE